VERFQPLVFNLALLLLAVAGLVLNKALRLDAPELSAVSYSIIVLDLFVLYFRHELFRHLSAIDVSAIDGPVVKSIVEKDVAAMKRSLRMYGEEQQFKIYNPIVARDLSFDMIKRLKGSDTFVASMNLAERRHLLGSKYTGYFNRLNKDAVEALARKDALIRIVVADEDTKSDKLYEDFVTAQRKMGINVLECDYQDYVAYVNTGTDVALRVSGRHQECLVGGREPKTPLDRYEATYVIGNAATEWRTSIEELLQFLGEGNEVTDGRARADDQQAKPDRS